MDIRRTFGALMIAAISAAGITSMSSIAQAADPLPRAKPEEVGMSSERLALIGKAVNAEIARGQLPGAVLAIARRGKLVYFESFGFRDKAAGAPMTTDAIFNIASMTKPMVAVGALQLYEQGRLLMDEPLAKYFPKFANMQVAVMDAKKESILETVPAARKITIQDLFRHTSGLIYGGRGTTAVHKLYPEGSSQAAAAMTGAEFLDQLSSRPLLYQPGTVWDYGFGLDVLGLVIEQLSEQSLGAYLQQNLWKPLGMTDTGFFIPQAKAARYAAALATDPESGNPQSMTPLTKPAEVRVRRRLRGLHGERLFAFRAHADEQGQARRHPHPGSENRRIHAVEPARARRQEFDRERDPTRADYGFGLGLAVRTTPGIVRMMGSVGDFSWPGASGTNWWADPHEELAVVWMAHSPGPIRWRYRQMINALVYQAIVD